ncbi:unnamed protein product [Didymodactylos carnosus]|uniref:Uncharacterized protein n=1 Tax=Didymodactylos carnosus TaxID=1234261 RepID=A0A816DIW2_9BILA|nr:unnamed protein product [Didymodactylos carnosus]CAF4544208.1 unnamed protein product [Didymodactylos carnosus]
MSSKYTNAMSRRNAPNTELITRWNVDGVFDNPNGIIKIVLGNREIATDRPEFILKRFLRIKDYMGDNLLEQAKRAEAATSLAQLSTITTTTTVETDDTTAAIRRTSNSPNSGNSHPQQPKWDTQDYRRSEPTYYGGSRPQ